MLLMPQEIHLSKFTEKVFLVIAILVRLGNVNFKNLDSYLGINYNIKE